MDEKPKSLDEICDFILKFCDDIYVREQKNGKWGTYRLSELPTKLALKYAMTWIKEGKTPHRIIRDEEQKEGQPSCPEGRPLNENVNACNLGYFSEPGCDY